MQLVQFDVDNSELREEFDRRVLVRAIAELTADSQSRWGLMKPQQMLEHLAWTYRLSTGKEQVDCKLPAADRERMKRFLYTAAPTPLNFPNPVLTNGLPALKHGTLSDARTALCEEIEFFWKRPAQSARELHIHPLFGPIDAEEWSRTHYKHGFHHLMQFGLVEAT